MDSKAKPLAGLRGAATKTHVFDEVAPKVWKRSPVAEPKQAKPKKTEPEKVQLKAPHDLLAAPLSLFNWSDAGVLWNEKAMGPKDVKVKRQWEDLVAAGYEPIPFSIVNQTAYFFFRKK